MAAHRIVVTGAGGFIGRALVAHLQRQRADVVPVSRSAAGSAVRDYADLAPSLLEGADAVVHLAARAHVSGSEADFEGNVAGAKGVARACLQAGVPRLVYLSSIGVNGNRTTGRPFTEVDTPAPGEPYARSKLRAEQGVREILARSGCAWTIVRPPLVYGPDAPGNFARLVHAVARGWPLPLASVRNRRSFVGVGNLCDMILACCSHPGAANETFVIADGDDLSTPDMVRCIAAGLRRPARLWPMPVALLEAGAALAGKTRLAESLCESLQVDASKARRLLDWKPSCDSHEGITRAAAQWSLA